MADKLIQIEVQLAQKIQDESWLNSEQYEWFRKLYDYASTQTLAIPTLSKVSPEALYNTLIILNHGAKREGIDLGDKLST